MASFIATLAFKNIWRGTAYTLTSAKAISGIPQSLTQLNFTKIMGIRSATFLMMTVFIVLFYILHFTGYGKKLYAVGGNAAASKIMGIKVDKLTLSAYMTVSYTHLDVFKRQVRNITGTKNTGYKK